MLLVEVAHMLKTDRWIEIDLSWFDPEPVAAARRADLFIQRCLPLYEGVNGEIGMIMNCGWVIDLVTEWTGNPGQALPFRTNFLNKWKTRTYEELRQLFQSIRQSAAGHGLNGYKIGVMFVGWGEFLNHEGMYDIYGNWYDRHREMYPMSTKMNPAIPLHEDQYPYAWRPEGIAEGTRFSELFAGQWKDLSQFLSLDAIHLRDSFAGEIVYERVGPFGLTAPADTSEIAGYSAAWIELYRRVKESNPAALVMGYSSAISAVAEWRVGCVDLERLVADGAIDIWIDQTWGGAWQDFWSTEWKGWTFQLAYLTAHRAVIEAGNTHRAQPCRHYHLIETWDGWEPFDTLHQVPGKLLWAIWAFSHAAYVDGLGGSSVPHGSYISWANNRAGQLLSVEDIRFLSVHLNEAQKSARQLEKVYGPRMVYNRPVLERLTEEKPQQNCSEYIDDYVGLLTKWGVPCLTVVRTENLEAAGGREILLYQVPGALGDEAACFMAQASERGVPQVLIGRLDMIDQQAAELVGLQAIGEKEERGFVYVSPRPSSCINVADLPKNMVIHLPERQPAKVTETDAEILLETGHTPLLVSRKGTRVLYWQPQDWSKPGNPHLAKFQLGDLAPYAMAARWIHAAAKNAGLTYLEEVPYAQPIAFHYWRSGGCAHLLFGNLETGLAGDARTTRRALAVLRREHLELDDREYRLLSLTDQSVIAADRSDSEELVFTVLVGPEACGIYKLCHA
jgi:hypothetical protein